MRSSVASKRNMPTNIDKALIAKIALFERCAGNNASAELYQIINQTENGMPEIIAELEKGEKKSVVPESWKEDEFILNWINLEPSLTGVDLRAVAYLARETLPLRFAEAGLSAAAEDALKIIVKAKSQSSPALSKAISCIPSDEYDQVMEAAIEELRKTTSWSKSPLGFKGAIKLAQNSPEAARKLKQFIAGIGTLPSWMTLILDEEDWWITGE